MSVHCTDFLTHPYPSVSQLIRICNQINQTKYSSFLFQTDKRLGREKGNVITFGGMTDSVSWERGGGQEGWMQTRRLWIYSAPPSHARVLFIPFMRASPLNWQTENKQTTNDLVHIYKYMCTHLCTICQPISHSRPDTTLVFGSLVGISRQGRSEGTLSRGDVAWQQKLETAKEPSNP